MSTVARQLIVNLASAWLIPIVLALSASISSAQAQTPLQPNPTTSCFNRYWIYGALLATGVATFTFDENLNAISQNSVLHSETADQFFRNIEVLGRRGPYYVGVPLVLAGGLIFKDWRSLMTAGELAAGLAVSEGVTQGIKAAFGRRRPSETESPYDFFKGGTSFYSGHTISIFTFATILAKNYPRQDLNVIGIDRKVPLVPILCYGFAGLVGLERLYDNHHWTSDVYVGALAGYAVGSLTVYLGKKVHLDSWTVIMGETPRLALNITLD